MSKSIFTIIFIAVLLIVNIAPTYTYAVAADSGGPIIAGHAAVDLYDKIPLYWINQVKKMYLNVPGESHSSGYRVGLLLLEQLDPTYQVINAENGPPTSYTDQALRVDKWVYNNPNPNQATGEAEWYTWHAWNTNDPNYPTARADLIKNHLDYCDRPSSDIKISAIGFGWCWDMYWYNGPGGESDNIDGVTFRWAGSSEGGPVDVNHGQRWGLDAGDIALTGNPVTMDDYLQATAEYAEYAQQQGYDTRVFFTTGPVDWNYTYNPSGENGYQREIKQQYIRDYVISHGAVLFDYADILTHNNDGALYQETLDGYTYDNIHPDNLMDYENPASGNWTIIEGQAGGGSDHIGDVGALRLGKAMWWFLARLAGWDGTLNRAPVADDQPVSTDKDTPKDITLTATDADGDGPYLTYSIVTPPAHGTLSPISGSSVTYTPESGHNGSDSFTFKANDGRLDSNDATVSILVGTNPPDTQAPSVTVIAPNGSEHYKKSCSYNITWTATDDSGLITSYNISYSIDNGVSYTDIATGLTNDGSYTWTVPDTPSATCLVRVHARDAAGNWGHGDSDAVFQIFGSIPGDANNDCVVNDLDIDKTEKIILGIDTPTEDANANGDEFIDVLDITKIEIILSPP